MGGFHDLATVRANFRCKYAFLLAPSSERLIENYTPYLTNMIGVLYCIYLLLRYIPRYARRKNQSCSPTYVRTGMYSGVPGRSTVYYFAEKNQEYCTCEVLVNATVVEEVHVKAGFLASSCDTLTLLIL